MSTALPIVQPSPDLVEQLLAEQQELTAVEEFSKLHDSGEVAGPAQARYYQKLLPATPPAPGQQFAFEVDLDQCSGCKACVVACHTMNGLEDDESWRRVGTVTIGQSSGTPRVQHVTTACHHCEDPGCLNGCPVKAYDKDPVTGIVRHLDDQCIGCKYCTMMCPYEVPTYSERLGIVRKCDMCHQRLSVGEAPACVQSCPNEAIKIKIVDQGTVHSPSDSLAAGAPCSTITRPSTDYQSKQPDEFAAAIPQDHEVDHVAESHWPLAVMLVATQISVGLILTERIAATIAILTGAEYPLLATQISATLALIVAGVGMGIAPLHLGQPLRAWRVFLGLRTSWLSREAVVLGKYTGALSTAVGLLWLPVVTEYVPQWITDLIPSWAAKAALGGAILLGIPGLISSAMIYVATKRQVWRLDRTFKRFLGSGLAAGASMAAPCLMISGSPTMTTILITGLAILSIAAKLAWEWKTHLGPSSPDENPYDARSRALVAGPLARTKTIRIQTALFGLGALVVACASLGFMPTFAAFVAIVGALAITGGELAERLLYFQSVVYDRMPGTL